MKAAVEFAHPDGTTQWMIITGAYLVTQQWRDGSALVTVYDRRGGKKLRAVHFAHASVIDLDRRKRRG